MKVLRRHLFCMAGVLGFAWGTGAVTVTDVAARQRWPWKTHVDVDVTLSGTTAGETYFVTLEALLADGATHQARTYLSRPLVSGDQTHRLVWDLGTDLPGLSVSDLKIRAIVAPFAQSDPLYMVIDLAGGTNATYYPVRYSRTPPQQIEKNDRCRTSELWLRRCPAGTFTMGEGTVLHGGNLDASHLPAHTVTLTKAYWLGIFETTQAQWAQVLGTWPSSFTNAACRATRPVESVSYSSIRGSAGWYDEPVASVSAKSFCGVLRAKTGLATLDLPTEAQWEYACRAGATGRFYWPAMTEATMGKWGRSKEGGVNLMIPGTNNQVPDLSVDTTYGTARVGSYPANPWGFYDMLGNLMDIVGDGNPWQNDSDYDASYTAIYTSPRMDPRGPPAHPDHPDNLTYWILRTGRGADITMSNVRLSTVYRRTIAPGNNARQWGFRIAVTED